MHYKKSEGNILYRTFSDKEIPRYVGILCMLLTFTLYNISESIHVLWPQGQIADILKVNFRIWEKAYQLKKHNTFHFWDNPKIRINPLIPSLWNKNKNIKCTLASVRKPIVWIITFWSNAIKPGSLTKK